LEDKMGAQIAKVQQQGDRLRDAAFARVDSKMASLDTLQSRFDKKLAELSGNYKGLSDEMVAQIRRIDQMDSRMWEWRHQLEEEMRSKFAEMEQNQQQMASMIRLSSATNEESIKQCKKSIKRLESLMEERLSCNFWEDTNQSLSALDARLLELETARLHELAYESEPLPLPAAFNGDAAVGGPLELESQAPHDFDITKMNDIVRKMDQLLQDAQEAQTKLEEQEVRLRSLRTLVDSQEERNSKFERQDWDGRLSNITASCQDLDKQRMQQVERLELVERKLEQHIKSYDELELDDVAKQLQRIQADVAVLSRSAIMAADTSGFVDGDSATNSPGHDQANHTANTNGGSLMWEELADLKGRVLDVEQRVDRAETSLEESQTDTELAPRVAALVDALQQVAPKVMDQERSVTELHEKVGQLEFKTSMLTDPAKSGDVLSSRINQVEYDLGNLKRSVESKTAMDSQPSASAVPSAHPPASIPPLSGETVVVSPPLPLPENTVAIAAEQEVSTVVEEKLPLADCD